MKAPAWFGINQPIIMPRTGLVVDSGITLEAYDARVEAYEAQDVCRSDAQGIVDCEILNTLVQS